MKGIKFLFFLTVGMGFAFLLTEQRMESKNYDLQINKLNKEIEEINAQKREISFLIERRTQRLMKYQSQNKEGTYISADDIVSVPLQREQHADVRKKNLNKADMAINRMIYQLWTLKEK